MKKNIINKITPLMMLLLLMTGCVEPYQLETTNFESALVIEATITNELKNQEIKLSKTYKFEENGPTFETGAHITVTDNLGNEYAFNEQSGSYVSENVFQAAAERTYKLEVVLANGKVYRSSPKMLTAINPITNLAAIVTTNSDGVRGVAINANNYDPSNTSKYYRYEYSETYKIIAPYWSPKTLFYDLLSDSFYLEDRVGETKTCYHTVASTDIILTDTNLQSEDRVTDFPVRFISNQNPIIAHRYSILAKQFVESLEAYTFYKTMKLVSSSESLLSQTQPGFFSGNIEAVENPGEKVIGFFDVASVSERRIFFNYSDLFPGEELPPYFTNCQLTSYDVVSPPIMPGKTPKELLIFLLGQGNIRYYSDLNGVYEIAIPECGDCTTLASNAVPSFWEN